LLHGCLPYPASPTSALCLAAATQVDIVAAGDQVNELMLIVAGDAVAISSSSAGCALPDGLLLAVDNGAGQAGSSSSDWCEVHGSSGGKRCEVPGGRARLLGAGDPAGEMAFFTETPCMEVRWLVQLCYVFVG
jgi:hypothetical protein